MQWQRVGLALVLCLLLGLGVSLLRGQQVSPTAAPSTPTVGTPVAQPSTLVVNRMTRLTVTSQITAPPTNPVVPASVRLERPDERGKILDNLGMMSDDGTQGDTVAGDGIFTLRVDFSEPAPGTLRLQVSATFRASPGRITSAIALVPIVANAPPVADAGKDLRVETGKPVMLDGSASFDPNGDRLTFAWRVLSVPPGSLVTDASLVGAMKAAPRFIPDVSGDYDLELQVSDGHLSATDTVRVTATPPNVTPNADAGPDQTTLVGMAVLLNGAGSTDPDNGPAPLAFTWSFAALPQAVG